MFIYDATSSTDYSAEWFLNRVIEGDIDARTAINILTEEYAQVPGIHIFSHDHAFNRLQFINAGQINIHEMSLNIDFQSGSVNLNKELV